MTPEFVLFVASVLAAAAPVSAQAAPAWIYIPVACSDQCSKTIESAYLCQNQYSEDATSIYGCFCNNYPTDASDCSTCLKDNNAAALATLLNSTQSACPQAVRDCFFQCSFDTCVSSDVACQCDGAYLENIHNCGACNTANGNTGATQLADWQALHDSCAMQNYTGADQNFTTKALPTVDTAGYAAPTLTATGGGVAATGDASASNGGLAATGGGNAGSSGASGTSPSKTTGKLAADGTAVDAGVAAVTSKGAAAGLVAPAFGGVLVFSGLVAVLF